MRLILFNDFLQNTIGMIKHSRKDGCLIPFPIPKCFQIDCKNTDSSKYFLNLENFAYSSVY